MDPDSILMIDPDIFDKKFPVATWKTRHPSRLIHQRGLCSMTSIWILVFLIVSSLPFLLRWNRAARVLRNADTCPIPDPGAVGCLRDPLSGSRPRAALVVVVKDGGELADAISTMTRIERGFNEHHGHPWVFFSPEELGDEFRRQAANVSCAPCRFKTISADHLVHAIKGAEGDDADFCGGRHVVVVHEHRLLREMDLARWYAGYMAHEAALRDLDWFWKVDPKSFFSCWMDMMNIFTFMQEYDFVHDFHKASLDDAPCPSPVWKGAKVFVRQNLDLIHPDADISWFARCRPSSAAATVESDEAVSGTAAEKATLASERLRSRTVSFRANGSKKGGRDEQKKSDSKTNARKHMQTQSNVAAGAPPEHDHLEELGKWVGNFWEGSATGPGFEIGSLDLLRSDVHHALFEYLDAEGVFSRSLGRDLSVHAVSAATFAARQRVWSAGRPASPRPCRHLRELYISRQEIDEFLDDDLYYDDDGGGAETCAVSPAIHAAARYAADERDPRTTGKPNATTAVADPDRPDRLDPLDMDSPCSRMLGVKPVDERTWEACGHPADRLAAAQLHWAEMADGLLVTELKSGHTSHGERTFHISGLCSLLRTPKFVLVSGLMVVGDRFFDDRRDRVDSAFSPTKGCPTS